MTGSVGVTLTVRGCVFENNRITNVPPGSSRTGGGAVAVFDEVAITGNLDPNVTGYDPSTMGGWVLNGITTWATPPVHEPFVFENTQFLSNQNYMGGQGGALWIGLVFGQVIVRSCTFDSNSVRTNTIANTGRGGALFFGACMRLAAPCRGIPPLTHARARAGYPNLQTPALSANYGAPDSVNGPLNYSDHVHLILESCAFTNNFGVSAGQGPSAQGGALFIDHFSGRVDITDCSFESNTAFTGGAVYYDGSGALSYRQLLDLPLAALPDWAVAPAPSLIGPGGGSGHDYLDYNFYVAGYTEQRNFDYLSLEPFADVTGYALTIADSSFTQNSAEGGAAAQAGALYVSCGAVHLLRTTFEENSVPCGSLGSAVLAANGCPSPDTLSTRVTLAECTLANNAAGALAAVQADPVPGGVMVAVSGSTLSGNWDAACPAACGSAAYASGAAAWLFSSGSAYSNHSSAVNGSAVCLAGGAAGSFSADAFSSNAASAFGGALYIDADSSCAVAENTTFADNAATVGACAFFAADSADPPAVAVSPSAGNLATNYGSAAATAPAGFSISVGGVALSAAVNASYNVDVASGKALPLSVTLLDAYGTPLSYWQDFTADVACAGCPAGALGGATHAAYFSSAAVFPTLSRSPARPAPSSTSP